MGNKIWIELYDDYDYLCAIRLREKAFLFVEITDMDYACGKDNEGHPTYVGEVALVDLNAISKEIKASAVQSCGSYDIDFDKNDLAMAECCFRYGCKAPLDSDSSNGKTGLLRRMKKFARHYTSEEGARDLTAALKRPVNRIGSTAAEFMVGDTDSAVSRSVARGEHTGRLIAKMYGISQDKIDAASDARPSDWMPYVTGYMDGASGASKRGDSDLAPEYHSGYDRGAAVLQGLAVAPAWLNLK